MRGAGFEPAKQYVLGPKPSAFDQARRPPPDLPSLISQMNLTIQGRLHEQETLRLEQWPTCLS